jgi:hydroxypyruvate isomerase
MPRLVANIGFLFTELPLPARFAAAAAAGFAEVEFVGAYDERPTTVAGWARDAGVAVTLLNTPFGDAAAGDRGLAAVPGREAEFRAGALTALEHAAACGCPMLHAMAGVAPAGPAAEATYRANLAWLADQAPDLSLTVEPISRAAMPGYYLNRTDQAIATLDAVARPNLGLQFDCFHVQLEEGDVHGRFARLLPRITHVQIANPPGRHEPGVGKLDLPWLIGEFDRLGYGGRIGCEYRPSTATTNESLLWMSPRFKKV